MITIFTNPSARAGYDTRSIFKRSLTEFSFSETSYFTKAEEPSLPYNLHIAGGRIIGFIPFPGILVLCEMQSVSSRFELVSPCSFPTTITITPRAPPWWRITVIKDGLKNKTEVPNLLPRCGKHWKRIWSSLRDQVDVRRRFEFESVLSTGRKEVKTQVEYQPQKC